MERTLISNYPPEIFINYKGKDGNFTVENMTDITLTRWSSLIAPVIRLTGIMYPQTWDPEKGTASPLGYSSKTGVTAIVVRKQQTNTKWGHSVKQLTLKNVKTEQLTRIGYDRGTWRLRAAWDPESGTGMEAAHQRGRWENPNKVCSLENSVAPVLNSWFW